MTAALVELAPAQLDMTEFEAAFKESIPCNACGEPAHWRSFGHRVNDCGGGPGHPPPPYYKCTDCYMAWREFTGRWLKKDGDTFGCQNCHRQFDTLEEFSDYRRF
jgi:hypothetical protein